MKDALTSKYGTITVTPTDYSKHKVIPFVRVWDAKTGEQLGYAEGDGAFLQLPDDRLQQACWLGREVMFESGARLVPPDAGPTGQPDPALPAKRHPRATS